MNINTYILLVIFSAFISLTNGLSAQDCSTLAAQFTATPIYCSNGGGFPAYICVTPSGGTAPYQLQVSSGGNEPIIISELAADETYCDTFTLTALFWGFQQPFINASLSIIDANNCNVLQMIDIPFEPFQVHRTIKNASCQNADGELCLTISGGSGTCHVWQGGIDYGLFYSGVTRCIGGLAAGTHLFTLIDEQASYCTLTIYADILAIDNTITTTTQITPNSTCSANDGSVCFTVNGGTAPYQIKQQITNNILVNNLAANTPFCYNTHYNSQYTITDFSGCQNVVDVVFPSDLSASITSLTPATVCNGSGQVCFSISGGIPPYTRFEYGDDYIVPIITDANFCINIQAGNQFLEINDNNCSSFRLDYTMPSPADNIQINNIDISNATCNANNANLCFAISGGVAPYQIYLGYDLWGNSDENATFCQNNLPVGAYQLRIVDANACQHNEVIEIGIDCPAVVQPIPCPLLPTFLSTASVCSGTMINLNQIIGSNDLIWRDNYGTIVTNDTALIINNSHCEPITYTYSDTHLTADGCEVTTQTISITVYPEIVASVETNLCAATLISNCPNYDITWTDASGNSGTGNMYSGGGNPFETVTFTVSNTSVASTEPCATKTYQVGLECTLYPCDPIPPTFITQTICSGTNIDLNAIATPINGTWYDPNGQIIADPNNYIAPENTTCEAINIAINDMMITPNCPPMPLTIISLQIMPEIVASVETNLCAATLISNCPNYDITWTDASGNSGTGNMYSGGGNPFETVTFSVSNTSVASTEPCATKTYQVGLECVLYPCDPIPPTFITQTICSGTSIDLNAIATPINGTWYDPNGQIIADPNNYIAPENTTCEAINIAINDMMITPNCPPMPLTVISLQIMPEPMATIIQSECYLAIEPYCPNLVNSITWNDNLGNSGNSEVYSGAGLNNTMVNFTINYNDNTQSCDVTTSIEATYYCNIDCSLIDPYQPASFQYTVCNDEEFALPTIGEQNQILTWYSDIALTQPIPDPTVVRIQATGCEPKQFTYYALYANNVPCIGAVYYFANITVYPDIIAAASLNDCGATIYTDCPNYIITWTDQNGNSGTSNVYTTNNVTDNTTVQFNISYPNAATVELTCSSLQITANVSCIDTNIGNELCQVLPQTVCTAPMTEIDLCVYCPEAAIFVQSIYQPLFSCGTETNGNCIAYTPLPGIENYGADSLIVIYCLTDNPSQCDTTHFIINVGNCDQNNSPIAQDDYAYSDGTTIDIQALSNDSDLDGDILTITLFGQPQNGSVELNNGIFYYTPHPEFEGSDLFSYQICDPDGACAYATVYIETSIETPCLSHTTICAEPVTPIILCPEFCNIAANTPYEIVSAQTTFNCALQIYEEQCLRYTALPLFAGQETIRIIACSNTGVCDTAYITVQVANCDPSGGFAPSTEELKVMHYFGNNDQAMPLQLINIMPQPATDIATIYFSAAQSNEVEAHIIDLNGRTLKTIPLKTVNGYNLAQIALDNIASGLYVLQLKDGKQHSTTKLLIGN